MTPEEHVGNTANIVICLGILYAFLAVVMLFRDDALILRFILLWLAHQIGL